MTGKPNQGHYPQYLRKSCKEIWKPKTLIIPQGILPRAYLRLRVVIWLCVEWIKYVTILQS